MGRKAGHVRAGLRRRVRADTVPCRSTRRSLIIAVAWSAFGWVGTARAKEQTGICRVALLSAHAITITPNAKRIAGLAAKARLPSIFHISEFADVGGLVSYGPC